MPMLASKGQWVKAAGVCFPKPGMMINHTHTARIYHAQGSFSITRQDDYEMQRGSEDSTSSFSGVHRDDVGSPSSSNR